MPHQTFEAVRLGVEREPITFSFGLLGEETFTVVPDPTLGDTFELHDAPEPSPTNELESAMVLARFIRRMLVADDRPRFDAALFRIPQSQIGMVIECAEWIARQVTGRPTVPAPSSSAGRQATGTRSSGRAGGARRSRR